MLMVPVFITTFLFGSDVLWKFPGRPLPGQDSAGACQEGQTLRGPVPPTMLANSSPSSSQATPPGL